MQHTNVVKADAVEAAGAAVAQHTIMWLRFVANVPLHGVFCAY
jgi:hypothetical protein